jgi:hypothetical protein
MNERIIGFQYAINILKSLNRGKVLEPIMISENQRYVLYTANSLTVTYKV